MPVVLGSQDAINSWLNDDLSEDALHKLTQPYEAADLVCHHPRTLLVLVLAAIFSEAEAESFAGLTAWIHCWIRGSKKT